MSAAKLHGCLRPLALITVSLLNHARRELTLARPQLSGSSVRRNATTAPASTATAEFLVPTIDIAPFLANPNCPAAERIVSHVRSACVRAGFFQITGHGVPRALQTSVLDAAAAFFTLPLNKQKLDASTTIGHKGYDVLATQSYEAGVLPDLKEGTSSTFLAGSLLPWPYPRILQRHLCTLTASTRLDRRNATVRVGHLDDIKSDRPVAPLRFLHYPPAPTRSASTQSARRLGASAQTDFGTITLLLQDANEGLEVLNEAAGEWVSIPTSGSGAYVVNAGQMLTAWTAGAHKSSVHRVINNVVFFFQAIFGHPTGAPRWAGTRRGGQDS